VNFKKLSMIFSVAFSAFIFCSLQFYELSSISHKAKMKEFEYGILAPANLPRVLEMLELVEQRIILKKSSQPLSQSEEWTEAKEELGKYSNSLKLKNDFHREISRKISTIQLRNSRIGLVLILTSLVALLFARKTKNIKITGEKRD